MTCMGYGICAYCNAFASQDPMLTLSKVIANLKRRFN